MTEERSTDTPVDVATLTYEQARDELVHVVARLEAGGEPLESSLALWERGEALAARCQEWLDGARERLAAAQAPRVAPGSAGDGDTPDAAPDNVEDGA
ncbi:exodeoxyribonuclease VII small subunit [Isoptericola sp. NEAU-Y5]|uniref:Exodeoxyribonuclease 7 small subunit n=1 Tax=Isoptericola luteus TaxID=2879484 RepID=A0ABS7ZBK4_9MICO|nr:exodeoxyribonuclease VII small subunit [Isoptericola sp. NEAU-Y5]MCA5892428.1 exodeoxyribonuclease VII small subunit [Isoptericola sp. NEAU-Y5]